MSDNKTDEQPSLSAREGQLLVDYILTAEGGLPKSVNTCPSTFRRHANGDGSEVITGRFLSNNFAAQADWDKFAAKAGFKNGNSARVSFASLKKKIQAMGDEGGVPAEPTPKSTPKSTPKKSSAAKRKALPFTPMKSAAVDDDEMDESPTKKVKITPKKSATKKEEPET